MTKPIIDLALLSVLIAPQSAVSYWLDLIGSMIVAFYLIWCGVQTIIEELKQKIQMHKFQFIGVRNTLAGVRKIQSKGA